MPASARVRQFPGSALLRRSVGDAAARRPACRHCRRTPLVGERIHFYGAEGGEEMVCDLCRPQRAEAPARTQLMHSPDHHRAVRVIGNAA